MSIEKFNNLTVFITGSCGTIGKEIIRILISETSANVIAIDNLSCRSNFCRFLI